MAESDDESFFEEPVFKEVAEEPETQALDFGDEPQEMDDRDVLEEANDDRDSPFIAQMPDTPPPPSHLLNQQQSSSTTPRKIAQFASKMGTIPPQVQEPLNVRAALDGGEQQATSTVMKRSAKITLSPTKTIKRKRFGCGGAVNTFVFMDFETSGRVGGSGIHDAQYRLLEGKLHEPHDYSNTLIKLIMETQRSEYPRITEMSYISVPREVFVRGQAKMKEQSEQVGNESLYVRLATNVHTRQINPELDEKQWNAYEASRIAGKSCLNLAREDLILKRTFAEEWPSVRSFLDLCPKPACLVAHNGLSFDYRVLYGELKRCGFIEKDMGIPDGVVFIDSYLAIRELEARHRNELHHATRLVDWKMLSEQVCLNRVPACEDIPSAVEEDGNRDEPVDSKNVEVHLIQPQCPIDPRTPNRPPILRGTHSEPPKLSGRRRLFDNELPGADHPLLFLNTDDWSPAKRRRVRPEYFRRIDGGRWDFNCTVAEMNTRNKLTTIYETVLKSQYNAHFAQDDTEALMQVCLAYGKDFLDYTDNKAADFPF
ncbi:hypothetical protein V3C99_014718 [Haemonchus contortus]